MLNQRLDIIRQEAEDLKHRHLEQQMFPILEAAFKSLCLWLPNRKIEFASGMGSNYLYITHRSKHKTELFSCKHSDGTATLEYYENISYETRERWRHTPLLKCLEVMSLLHDQDGRTVHLDSLTYNPTKESPNE